MPSADLKPCVDGRGLGAKMREWAADWADDSCNSRAAPPLAPRVDALCATSGSTLPRSGAGLLHASAASDRLPRRCAERVAGTTPVARRSRSPLHTYRRGGLGGGDPTYHNHAKRDGPSPIVAPHWGPRSWARIGAAHASSHFFSPAHGARRALSLFHPSFLGRAIPVQTTRENTTSRLIAKQRRAAPHPALPPLPRANPARMRCARTEPPPPPPSPPTPAAHRCRRPPPPPITRAAPSGHASRGAKYRFKHRGSRSAREVSCRISPCEPALMRPTWTDRGGPGRRAACRAPRAPPTTCRRSCAGCFCGVYVL